MADRAALFDFDGTLADTAGDLGAALNHLRAQKGMAPLAVETVKPYASMGARGMLRIGFGLKPDAPEYLELRDAFLRRYEQNIFQETRLFPGIHALIAELGKRGIAWGIVTNKAQRFTDVLVRRLEIKPDVVTCGDSTPHLKPHPASLLLAAERLKILPEKCFYLGDDQRDIQAARAAGMHPVAVTWGYPSPDNEGPASWNADALIDQPAELLHHMEGRHESRSAHR